MILHGGFVAQGTMSRMEIIMQIASWTCGTRRRMKIASHGMMEIAIITPSLIIAK
jgi:hypothetical protein